MKPTILILLVLFLLGNSQLRAQQGIQWSDPIQITTSGDKSAVVGLLEDGTPVVIWGKGSQIFFSRMEGDEFTVPQEISTSGISADIYSFGGIDMAVRENQIHLVFENFADGVFHIRSTDGGVTFEKPVNVYDPPAGKWATLPSIELDDNGNPLVSVIFENTNETQGKYVLMASPDSGQSFNPPVFASDPADGDFVCECCPSDIYTRDSTVWLIFRNNNNNLRDMWVSKSTDGGSTFEEAVDVDATDWVLNACPISGPKMAPLAGDSLVTVWSSGASGSGRVYFSTLNGLTMEKGFETVIPQTNTNSSQSNAAVAGARDTVGIVWEENGFGFNSIDLMFAFSKNGTEGLLTNMTNITDDFGSQRRPSLAFSHGAFHLVNTDGAGGLEYRRGLVTDVTSVNRQEPNFLDITLIQQPVTDGIIKLKCSGQNTGIPFLMHLYDLSGKIVQTSNHLYTEPNGTMSIRTGEMPAGLYLLSLNSKQGYWNGKVLIVM